MIEFNVLILQKPDGERYVFKYAGGQVEKLYAWFAVFAADPELSFTWADAGKLLTKARAVQPGGA